MVLESNTLDVLFVKDGQQGEDGKVLYTWIKYAKDANGTGMTDDPNGAVYIGISYNNESSTESNDPTQYAWTKIQGADGKKGEDAYTIFLENENISFATDKNRNPLSEQAYTSGITIMKGAKPVTDFTIGDITKTQGIAVAKTDTAIAISVVNGNPLPSDSGEIVIPISVGGTVFKKVLTWTCAKKGDQGEKGEQGIQGPQGEQGIAGKDGTSVTIINKSITYQLSTSGTTIPTGTWQTSPQTIPEGQYQWTKTSVTYSDGNKTESYSISYHGKNGSDGTSVKTTSTSVKYQVGDSGTTKPTGTWQSNVPTVAQGKYLWTQTIVNYSDGNSTESYSVSYRGIDGSNGVNGMNAATVYLYQRATSTPSKPSNTLTYTFSTTKITGTLNNGWSTAIPTGTDAVYVTVASVSSKNDTATIATSAWSAPVVLAQNGKTGSDGKAGLNVATIYLYQRNISKPSKPSASVTYTFSTGVASGLNNGWSQKIPDGTNPLYVTLATASSNTATDTILSSEWSNVVVMAQNGEDGQDGTSIKITSKSVTYQTSTSGTTVPTGTWVTTVPTVANGQYLWTKTTVQYSDGNKTEAYSVSYKGTNGTNGTSVTVSKTEVTYQVSISGTTAPTGTWSTTMPSCDQGQYLWTKTYVKYSDGKETTSYSVSYKGVDGEKFAFNMLRETNQGSKHWVNIGASGKYSVESITTEDSINAVKLICTEPIASNEWQFCDFSDYEMLKSLKASTTYTLSYDIKTNRSGKILHNIKTGGGHKVFFANDIACKVLGNETWEHVSLKMTSGTTLPNLDGQVIYMFGDALSKVGYSIIKNLKLTEGIVDTPWAPHPKDLEGRGVSQTVQYYLATSQASGVTSSTSGWSTDITTQKLTADKKYLWNCYQTKYSDGTSEPISTPKVIGVYGDKGTSTKIIRTSYEYTQTNIDKFSTSGYSGVWGVNDATTGLKVGDSVLLKVKNTTKGSDCLIFANITAIPSNYSLTCTSYGVIDNGSDGQDGAGFHWNLLKYSGDLSKQVLGGAGTYTATVESIEDKTTPSGQAEKITYTVQGTGGKCIQTGKYIKEGDIKQGKTYTVSVWCKCSSIKSTGVINAEFLDNKTYVNPTLSTEWQQYVVTGVANKDVTSTSSASAISFYYSDNMSVGDIFYISSPKVEEGDKASPWCTTYEETLAKNLSITPSSQYFKSTDGGKTFAPNTITIKPTIQGEINFGKWQYSIDGGVSFADVVSGQKGLTISNNVLTISKDSSLYSDAVTMVTFRAVASDSSFYDTCSIAKIYDVSDIGDGRNLLTGVSSYTKDTPFEKTDSRADGWIVYQNIITSIELEAGKKYVLQAKTDGNWTANHDTSGQDPSKKLVTLWLCSDTTNDFFDMRQGYVVFTPTVTAKYKLRVNQYSNGTDAYTIHLWDIKLEKGSSPTGWTPAPEDVQTAILSTKSEISDVSLKVDKNKQAIEQRVEKTTYQQDLNLVKGDISKANEGLNKWRYEIYPKSLFDSTDQGKSTIDIFAKNKNLTPSRTVLFNDTDLSIQWNSAENYIGYALTFTKFSAAKSVAITFAHDDGAHIYLNGKLIGGSDVYSQTGESLTLGFVKGWNCIEVVVNEGANTEGFKLGTTISALSECQLMNCYYGTPVARQSHITNQLVQNTTDIDGVSGSVQKVMSTVGGSGKIDEFVSNYSTWKKKVDGIETRVGETYTTKSDFDGLEIGGRNLLLNSSFKNDRKSWTDWGSPATRELVTSNNKVWAHIVGNKQNYQGFNQWTESGSIKTGDNITFSARIKGGAGNQIFTIGIHWMNSSNTIIDQTWHTFTVGTTDGVYTWTTTASGANCSKLNLMVGVSDTSTAYNVYFTELKLEKGNKATDWTPAPEDNEINGQNLVSNLPANWEQGSFVVEDDSKNKTYSEVKVSEKTQIRIKELIPVFGDITISAQTTQNSSKEALNHYVILFDANKRYMGKHNVNGWNASFPRIFNCSDAKYIAIALKWGDGTKTQITPSDISQICLKIERGTSATPFTLAPEDVNGKIVNVETIATQTATEIGWLINRNGSTASSLKLTENALTAIAENINLTGRVKFSSLSTDAKQGILNSFEVGGRNLLVQKNITQGYLASDGKGSFVGSGGGDQTSDWIDVSGNKYITITLYEDFTNTNNSGRYCEYDADKNCINTVGYNPRQKSSVIIELKSNTKYIRVTAIECKTRRYKIEAGNKATDWTPAPEDVSQDATNKASQALTDANNYSSSAVNWVTNNGSSTTSLNSMVKKWTDGAVSDTTQINGGWIKTNTITANKIAIGDFTNYADINESNTYWFRAEQTKEGTWFYRDGSELQRDNVISELHTCRGGETFYVEYDISNTIKEGDEYKYAGLMIFGYDGNGGIVSYNRNAGVTATANGEITHITTQLTMPDTTRSFRVYLQIEGHVPFTGTLKIRNISVRKAVTGNLIVDGAITADKIATDAIKSRNYISSGCTQGSFLNLKDGSFNSPNLSWDSNGNLIAKNANIIGNLTAGTVGEWKIDKYIYSKDKVFFDINKHNGQSIYNKNSTNNLFLGDGKVSSFYWFTTQNNTFIIENGNLPQYATGPAGISFGTNIAQGQIELYESVFPGKIIPDYETTSHTSELSISGSKISFSYYDSNGSSFSDSPYTYIMADYARFYGDIFVQGSITTDEGVDVGGKLQASSIAAKNGGLIETSGTIYGGGEIQCGGGQMRIIGGDYGILLRNDGSDFYILSTDSGNQWGYWNSKRPFRINLANGIPYFEYGIIIPNENYLLGNGYQLGRGTSWGGVCLGDNSKQLRLYGTSIWASHSISTSDENLKENFTTLDQYEDFYMNLNPIGFNYIGDYDGKKTHFGFGAHKTEDILESEGYNSDKFAVVTRRPLVQEDIEKRFGKDVEVDIEMEYGVSYTEFIALNTHMIQKTRRELEQVKQEKENLEARLQAIEAKLGL